MRKTTRIAVSGVAALGLVLGTAAPAFAVHEINLAECNFESRQYFTIWDNQAGPKIKRCFADAGTMEVRSSHVGGFSSGNNAGWFEYEPGDGWRYRHYFKKWETINKNYSWMGTLHID
ncbi:beta/gamma crystallin domain-containing protein [Lentzea sp. E54]|uniref:beta/gamma crystallin domain-containing protein n=1 Tax=Lentzea xerophila TaxID=3435883 RepID=UPI003DA30C1A